MFRNYQPEFPEILKLQKDCIELIDYFIYETNSSTCVYRKKQWKNLILFAHINVHTYSINTNSINN